MSEKFPRHYWRNLGAAFVGLAAIVSAGVALYDVMREKTPVSHTPPSVNAKDNERAKDQSDAPSCKTGWNWENDLASCVRKITIPPKSFAVKTDRPVVAIDGRIDFYLNQERRPGTDATGKAIYKAAPGSVQVVIPIMQGTTMIGDMREVIFHTSEGIICSIDSLPESTGWMKTMHVSYNVRLDSCGDLCRISLSRDKKHVDVYTSAFQATISDTC